MPANPQQQECALIATLGSEPQVVSAALALLLARGEAVCAVDVLHTTSSLPVLRNALSTLDAVFAGGVFAGIRYERHALQYEGIPCDDLDSARATEAALQNLYGLVYAAKQAGRRVHLCIAGGRKTFAMYGMVAAQMLFDRDDRLWHLFSRGEFLASKRLLPGADDDVQLVAVPVMLRDFISPALTWLRDISNAQTALARLKKMDIDAEMTQAERFVMQVLSPAEALVVGRFVREGLSHKQLAAVLHLSVRTVENHLRNAYRKAADYWQLENVTGNLLISLLKMYYTISER